MPSDAGVQSSARRLGALTATMIVVANMVGTGIFATTGFLVSDIGSLWAVLIAWLVGGILALCGALSYAELAAAIPRNGGEYWFLSRIYHPAVGFVAGWISLIVGFSAPIAASALAFGKYIHAIAPSFPSTTAAIVLVIGLSILHALHVTLGGGVQNFFSLAKVVLIVGFIAGGLLLGSPASTFAVNPKSLFGAVMSPAFAVGLILVSFAYSGWNGVAYLAGEVRRPSRTLPMALVLGTSIVIALYVGLNIIFLWNVPTQEISGVVEVGHVAAVHIFGARTGDLVSGLIALALVSSVSAMIMAGPRVYETMGRDYPKLAFLGHRTKSGGPTLSTALQALLAIGMILTASFGALLTYIGFTLSLSAGLTVVGVIVLRRREPTLERRYRTWGYPWTPILFIALCLWMTIHSLIQRPVEAFAGLATIGTGLGLYILIQRKDKGAP